MAKVTRPRGDAEKDAPRHLACLKEQEIQVSALREYECELQRLQNDFKNIHLRLREKWEGQELRNATRPAPKTEVPARHTPVLGDYAARTQKRMEEVRLIAEQERQAREEEERIRQEEQRRIEQEQEQKRQEEERKRREEEQKQQEEEAARQREEAEKKRLKDEEEAKRQQEQQQQQQQATAAAAAVPPQPSSEAAVAQPSAAEPPAPAAAEAAVAASSGPISQGVSCQEDYERLRADFGPKDAQVVGIAKAKGEAKMALLQIKKEVSPHVAAIVPAVPVCKRVINELCQVLAKHQADPLNGFYSMLALATRFVPSKQTGDVGDKLIYGYAAVGVHVGLAFPEFLRIWRYLMHKACPLTAPVCPSGPSADQALGREKDEDADAWNTRVGLCMRQFAVFLQTDINAALIPDMVAGRFAGRLPAHPFGLDRAWVWTATVLNFPPEVLQARRDVWTTALAYMLDRAGHALLGRYRWQCGKLLAVIQGQYLPLVSAQAAGGDTDNVSLKVGVQMLQDFFEAYHKGGVRPCEARTLDAAGSGQVGQDMGY